MPHAHNTTAIVQALDQENAASSCNTDNDTPHQILAKRVISQAIRDAAGGNQDAIRFLVTASDEWRTTWCLLAEIPERLLRDTMREHMQENKTLGTAGRPNGHVLIFGNSTECFQAICEKVSLMFGSPQNIGKRKASRARHVSMALAYDLTNSPYEIIANFFSTDVTTIGYAVKQIRKRLENEEFRAQYDALKGALQNEALYDPKTCGQYKQRRNKCS